MRQVMGVYSVTIHNRGRVREYQLSHPSARRLQIVKNRYSIRDGLVWKFPDRCECEKPLVEEITYEVLP